MAGRKTKYSPEVQERIVQAIRLGATYQIAAQYGGIHPDTFYEWIKKHSDFSDAIKEAEGLAAVGWLEKIEKEASDGNWQAAAWKLERRYPKDYGRRSVDVELSGNVTWQQIVKEAQTGDDGPSDPYT